ncbi:16S rRNA (cytosine(1402)-N(4))-methyltransferase RsmH [Gordonia sp. TBRC 11910]|uniref:Ribosomal RNA small subunit methyltransferase H n=1 Tax=Gordonia asplenii TaxID=2725283 RepID=A0A848KY96_9ACTN|nr:16S rRNA (cytosine(1402)-N(4))-methyltransferase RsmH [Gordonia asplenii]NMO03329.1 16S rRNA (cytosine(1402)-N(4))-methyltransferase RsmH [Gordonia asplenii]
MTYHGENDHDDSAPTTSRRSGEFGHVPVMGPRIIELLTPALTRVSDDGSGAVVVDATLGAGGHSELLLETFPGARVLGIDRDDSAIAIARQRLSRFGERIEFHRARYDELPGILAESGRPGARIDGALFDLGVSSMQLDQADRGFAYSVDAPLDMRMNPDDTLTAAEILNTYSHGELARVLSEYGEERFAGKIASAVLRARETEPFTTSARLVELLYSSIPAATRRTGGHPAKRTFQALRIEVNHELDSLRHALPAALASLSVGGRVVVMSYQSLEDKIVKREFAQRITSRTPPGLPMELPGAAARFALITRGAERPDDAELERNPRSAPVRVRAIERIAEEAPL